MVIGVVCEYNPFHNGHLYQLEAAREALGPGATIVCSMSGDFVQRGEAAVYSKFARAEAACRCGADLVVELPLPWCLSSAEGFARGAVGMLAALGAERICFGSESGDTKALNALADTLLEGDFIEAVKQRLSADPALSFAAARQQEAEVRRGTAAGCLGKPNDILAVEYLKAIRTLDLDMEPLVVPRRGAAHDSPVEDRGFLSASALRERLRSGASIAGFVPPEAEAVFRREREHGRELSGPDALETALLSRLLALDEGDFSALPDAADGLGTRVYRAVRRCGSFSEIVAEATTKRYAAARVRRLLLCACLGVKAGMAEGTPPYARILAASERGRGHLRALGKDGGFPLLTKPAAVKELPKNCETLFSLGAAAHDLYVLGYEGTENRRPGEDWRRGPVVLSRD